MVGFSGTRKGMTTLQLGSARELLNSLDPVAVHHGDCVGADADFHKLCRHQGIPIVIHPPTQDRARAMCNGPNVTILPPQHYLVRNRGIIDACNVMVAAPAGPEVVRSGTWSTVRYAKKKGKTVYLILPSGVIVPPPIQ